MLIVIKLGDKRYKTVEGRWFVSTPAVVLKGEVSPNNNVDWVSRKAILETQQ